MNRSVLRWWFPGAALAILAAGEWLRVPAAGWVAAACLGAVVCLVSLWPWRGLAPRFLAGAVALLGLLPLLATLRVASLRRDWPLEQQARVDRAALRLDGDLHAAYLLAGRLAAAGAAAPTTRPDAFKALARAVRGVPLEAGLSLLDADGRALAWAGSHRLPPRGDGNPVSTASNPFYLVLEVARPLPDGRRAVGSVVVWASSAVPERVQSVTEDFRRRTGVGLKVYPAGTGPDLPDVFDYTEPTTAGPRLLFSVEPVPPALEDVEAGTLAVAARATALALLLALLAAVLTAQSPTLRLGMLVVAGILVVHAPVGATLGPVRWTAGALAAAAGLVTILAVALWHRPPPRRWFTVPLAWLLLTSAPLALRFLAGGLAPPAHGAPLWAWLAWHGTIALAAMAPALLAAALLRGEPRGAVRRSFVWGGTVLAAVAGLAGLAAWRPDAGWPWWYLFLWLPGLLLVTRPVTRGLAILGISVVAGSGAALLTWGAELDGRLNLVQGDALRLGVVADSAAGRRLEDAGAALLTGPAPGDAAELYARWYQVRRGLEGYPVRLALRHPDGTIAASLTLDSLELGESEVAAVAAALPPGEPLGVTAVPGLPAPYLVLAVRFPTGTLGTVTLGPRTRLLPPDRLGSILEPAATSEPPYRLALSPPMPEMAPASALLDWRRDRGHVHGEGVVTLLDGAHLVHAEVDLRGRFALAVRGVLLVALDLALLALLWLFAEAILGVLPPAPSWARVRRSFRARVALALVVFFLVPAAGFAAYEFSRLNREAEQQRDEAIALVLRDVVAASGGAEAPADSVTRLLEQSSRRFRTELALYRAGARQVATDSVLSALAILAPLQDPEAFLAMAEGGEPEAAAEEPLLGRGGLVGYRAVGPVPSGDLVAVAAPRAAEAVRLAASQADLGWLLLLATLAGIAAALTAAGRVADALARPVGDLRRAALAIGRGAPIPPPSEEPPSEFEPVVAAFGKMADDLRAGRAALEESRRTTAAVLSTVSTGVVGLGPDGTVLVANPRAEELLGAPLAVGRSFLEALGAGWPDLRAAVGKALSGPASVREAELDDGTRRLAAALTPLGPELGGAVLAVNDITELSRAERVLAWGEMARQVAHEIKNPLTPMRLGVQHLKRVHRDRPMALGEALEETADRILAEIERLDTIARAFSRFAAPAGPAVAPDRLQLAPLVAEVVHLYRLAGEGAEVVLEADEAASGRARADEVKEVLVNLLENARQAGARRIVVRVRGRILEVRDDGAGIAEELLPRIFEPRFSTTSSGSGLGLAIVKRLVEGWAGTIRVESAPGLGTTVRVELA